MYQIIIREQIHIDTPQISELVRKAYISNATNMFIGSLLNETTFQLIVIVWAILFIIFQVHIINCIIITPIIILLIYIVIYSSLLLKSAQIIYEKKPLKSWVAEAYEPYFCTTNPEKCYYQIVNENELETDEKPTGRRTIIGTIAIMKHKQNSNWAWLFRLAVDKKYRRKGLALHLINIAKYWCKSNRLNKIELAMTECQYGARELFDKAGFDTKQLYHKKMVLNVYSMQMFSLECDLKEPY